VNITSPKLIFSVITEEDEGVYHCIATNDDGSVESDNATITVYGELHIAEKHNHMLHSRHSSRFGIYCQYHPNIIAVTFKTVC